MRLGGVVAASGALQLLPASADRWLSFLRTMGRHSLLGYFVSVELPYGVLSIMSSLNALNPNLERAAMSLGANRFRTFLAVTLPLTLPGVAGGFLLAFSIAISAYATPAILGGPASETMATLIRNLMVVQLDWALGSAMGALLLVSALGLLLLSIMLGERRTVPA